MTNILTLWTLGLTEEECGILRQNAGASYRCQVLDTMDSRHLAELLDSFASSREEKEEPLLLWLGSKAWLHLAKETPDLMRRLSYLPVVLLLSENPEPHLLEEALDAGFQQVLRAPLQKKHVHEALSRALEVRNLYQDMSRMSREILMTRELLNRKSEVCALMLRLFSVVSEAEDARDLLRRCGDELRSLLDLRGIHALWWGGGREVFAFIGQDDASNRLDAASSRAWCEFLLGEAPAEIRTMSVQLICCGGSTGSPDAGKVLWLPLETRGNRQGMLALMFVHPLLAGRDMALALDAIRHFITLALEGFMRDAREELQSARACGKAG